MGLCLSDRGIWFLALGKCYRVPTLSAKATNSLTAPNNRTELLRLSDVEAVTKETQHAECLGEAALTKPFRDL
jgi:hypothetical protein